MTVLNESRRAPVRVPTHIAVGLGLSCAALVYAFVVPRGLPYDEPSHWAYVRFLAEHWTLPVLGDPRVGYEAQQGPVAYIPAAAVLAAWRILGGSDDSAFYTVRALGFVVVFLLFLIVRRIVQMVSPAAGLLAVTVGSAVAVFNPMVVAMCYSVQNDGVSLVLTALLVLMALKTSPGDVTSRRASALVPRDRSLVAVGCCVLVNACHSPGGRRGLWRVLGSLGFREWMGWEKRMSGCVPAESRRGIGSARTSMSGLRPMAGSRSWLPRAWCLAWPPVT